MGKCKVTVTDKARKAKFDRLEEEIGQIGALQALLVPDTETSIEGFVSNVEIADRVNSISFSVFNNLIEQSGLSVLDLNDSNLQGRHITRAIESAKDDLTTIVSDALQGYHLGENLMENAIVAMVECSKMYKTAAYFSAACTRQESKGSILSVENLELNSEESRILAQSLATTSEENKRNYSMAAKLSAGLSALTKRLAFAGRYDTIKRNQYKAQYQYDIGRACHLKAKSLLILSPDEINEEKIEKLQKKAIYYYYKAEDLWENMLQETLYPVMKDGIKNNLSIVNDYIIENDVELIDDNEALEIQDPEPLIIVPENLAPFIPRTTNFLTKYKQSDLNFDAYLRYKNLMSDVLVNFNKIEELKNTKAGIGRTIKQLKILYENNDIDINSFSELFEKYSIKLENIESAIRNLKPPENKKEQKKLKPPLIQSTVR